MVIELITRIILRSNPEILNTRLSMNVKRITFLIALLLSSVAITFSQDVTETKFSSFKLPNGWSEISDDLLDIIVKRETENWNTHLGGEFFSGFVRDDASKIGNYPMILMEYISTVGEESVSFEDAKTLFSFLLDSRSFELAIDIGLDSTSVFYSNPVQKSISYFEPVLNPNSTWIMRLNTFFIRPNSNLVVYGLYPVQDITDFYKDYTAFVSSVEVKDDVQIKRKKNSGRFIDKIIDLPQMFMYRFLFTTEGRLKFYMVIFLISIPVIVISGIVKIIKWLFNKRKY